jgi:HD-GYP domain-containing protein (c-di-GMP phosphodiesterase class II)
MKYIKDANETEAKIRDNGSHSQAEPGVMHIKDVAKNNKWLGLLYKIGQRISSESDISKLVEQITQITQQSLKASASSILLFDAERQELFFEVAEGKAGQALKHIRIGANSGIAGWVASHGEPLIINDVTKDWLFNGAIDHSTGFVTRSVLCVPLTIHRKTIGVIEVLNKLDGGDFTNNDLEILTPVAATAAMAIENTKLNESVINGYKNTVRALAGAIDAKDPYTHGHSERVTEYTLIGGISLGLSSEEMDVLEYAAILHDVGKIGIADTILSKQGPLSPQEETIMRQHPVIGAKIIGGIPFLNGARKLILHHHEKYDGTGYPSGLKGQEIPIGARLLAVADTFDSITTDRAYRAAQSIDSALEELDRHSGTQFCPVALKAFISGFKMNAHIPSI